MAWFRAKPQPIVEVEQNAFLCGVSAQGKLVTLTFCKNGQTVDFEFVATWSTNIDAIIEMIKK